MKKYLKLLFVALFATLSFTLVSCGDDDDDDNALVGTWEGGYIDPDDGWQYYQVITFNKDNTFATTITENSGTQVYVDNIHGTYAVAGDLKKGAAITMNMIDEDGDTWTETGIIRVDGNKAYGALDGDMEMVFTRK